LYQSQKNKIRDDVFTSTAKSAGGVGKSMPAVPVLQQKSNQTKPVQLKSDIESQVSNDEAGAFIFTNNPGDNIKAHHDSNKPTQIQLVSKRVVNPVAQLAKTWTKAKVKRYKDHLRRRAGIRKKKGKLKNTQKLLRKYMNARWKVSPNWIPRLADPPNAGHHVPPLALSNNLSKKGGFAFGERGSKGEKKT